MDDSCAVCAETLEWVAYGPCGHREVCSTCVARLRFICDDRRCCICKSETNSVFVTKDLGEFTKTISDFSVLPANPSEGRVGSYWYHEATQAYFDDLDCYKMIKAMCDLSCGACANINELRKEGLRRRTLFENIEQLKSHLFHRHNLYMCSLCLEGRKVFICEQKLYTVTQLQQHVKKGDSDVDGSETERGGFMGHPSCEFCENPFYGENELYKHMSTEHYTCHLCQRQHPGQYEYYRDYNNLEIHFRQQHYLCEDANCLAKKFIVFVTESEMKRHNAIEHKGHMSRSERNAALQIPISFQYRRSNELDHRGRRHGNRHASTSPELSIAIQASMETATASRSRETSSAFQSASNNQRTSDINSTINSIELLNLADVEPSSRYRQSLGQSSNSTSLMDSSFPPLPNSSKSSRRKRRNDKKRSGLENIAASFHHQDNGHKNASSSHVLKVATSQTSSSSSSTKSSPTLNLRVLPSSADSSGPSQMSSSVFSEPNLSSHINRIQDRQVKPHGNVSADSFSSRLSSSSRKIGHSTSAPNGGSSGPSLADFPPISVSQTDKLHLSNKHQHKTEHIHNANKSLVENIRTALEFDEDKYAAFKLVSAEFRHDEIGTREYIAYIHQFGLSHLVFELARLCPDANKRKELLETVNLNRDNGVGDSKKKEYSTKGKEKCDNNGSSSLNYGGNSNNMQSNRMLATNDRQFLRNGGHDTKGKSKMTDVDEHVNFSSSSPSQSKGTTETDSAGALRKEGNKPQKKVPKFLRNRIGDNATTALSDSSEADPYPCRTAGRKVEMENSTSKLPVRGVWKNGGGHKLVAMTQRRPTK